MTNCTGAQRNKPMTNAQKLKMVAELLGYDTNPAETDGVSIDYQGHWFDFDPSENPAQLIEVEDWLNDREVFIAKQGNKYRYFYCVNCDKENLYCETIEWSIGRYESRATVAINAAAEIAGGSDGSTN